jgi:cytidylate kinase
MVADINARAERRRMDLLSAGTAVELDVLKEDIRRRDETDSTREESPLTPAPDAVRLDTSNLSIEEQVDFVVSRASEIAAHEDHDR